VVAAFRTITCHDADIHNFRYEVRTGLPPPQAPTPFRPSPATPPPAAPGHTAPARAPSRSPDSRQLL
jgi:hypothetical protein